MIDYHAETLALLDCPPALCPLAPDQIAQTERRLKRPFPEALRQWYSLAGVGAVLDPHRRGDSAQEVFELGTHAGDSLGDARWVIRSENQGVCCWAVELDGTPDPPVVVSFDLLEWAPAAESFSQYLRASVWDQRRVFGSLLLLQAQNAPLSEAALSALRRDFPSEVVTRGFPGHTQHRFETRGQRVLIWEGDLQADWWLSADDADSLASLIARVGALDEVAGSLWANDPAGEEVLVRVRDRSAD